MSNDSSVLYSINDVLTTLNNEFGGHSGDEVAYWTSNEWQEDPILVMGAIVGAMKGTDS